jgi:hypothetical protein
VCGWNLATFEYSLLFLLFVVVMEEFVASVFKGGKVTVPERLRELLGVEVGGLRVYRVMWILFLREVVKGEKFRREACNGYYF